MDPIVAGVTLIDEVVRVVVHRPRIEPCLGVDDR
jgi:hypothetical protein